LIKGAAAHLGVSPATLRNWERAGKLIVRRHPINGYRLYELAQLDEILERARTSGTPDSGYGSTSKRGHCVNREPANE
jgi:DNA-binding transcriptional MerR regulator